MSDPTGRKAEVQRRICAAIERTLTEQGLDTTLAHDCFCPDALPGSFYFEECVLSQVEAAIKKIRFTRLPR